MEINNEQFKICEKYGIPAYTITSDSKIGISQNIREPNSYPIHGLRYNPEEDTSGWYIWLGDYKENDDFFVPLHIGHLLEWRPEIIKFLALPPGYRFLIGENGYEDIWFDESLLL